MLPRLIIRSAESIDHRVCQVPASGGCSCAGHWPQPAWLGNLLHHQHIGAGLTLTRSRTSLSLLHNPPACRLHQSLQGPRARILLACAALRHRLHKGCCTCMLG